jgi:hypothetical protein
MAGRECAEDMLQSLGILPSGVIFVPDVEAKGRLRYLDLALIQDHEYERGASIRDN